MSSTHSESNDKMMLPLIAVRGNVAFPAIQTTLELSRPFTLKAFSVAAASEGLVFLLAQKDVHVEVPKDRDFYKIGTVASVKHVGRSPDGMLSVTFEGKCRAKFNGSIPEEDYLLASVSVRQSAPDEIDEERAPLFSALRNSIFNRIDALRALHPAITDEFYNSAKALHTPGFLSDFIASSLFITNRNKQKVLECNDLLLRMERVDAILEEEEKILRCEHDIHRKVKANLEEHQREYFLREQVKVIQQELGDVDDEIEEYSQKIEALSAPDFVKDKLTKELSKLAKTPFGAAESAVLRNYLDTCLELPWNQLSKEKADVTVADKILNDEHYGLEKIKERILEFIAVKQLSSEVKNQILCLVGPPGVGKTSIAASIAKALNRQYVRVSLGGIRDEADIRGHRKTYVGAMPGRIVDALRTAGTMNPLIVLDEVDKLTRDAHGDPSSALLEVLDPEQNKYFRDHFLEMPFDLSECIFLATANSFEAIPEPLIDRMEIIKVNSYSRTEKLEIAQRHLIRKQMKRHGLTGNQFRLDKDALLLLIDAYTAEAGVRNLEREIASLCRKAAKEIVETQKKRITVTPTLVKKYLGKAKFQIEKTEAEDAVGLVNGLAYTAAGGDLLKVETVVVPGKGKVELTGSLGDVMKESARIAISYIRSVADRYGISPDFATEKDIHIHFPEGAIPKDGPSAGVTMTTAILSTLTDRPVRHDVAMTGEITLRGRVLPIGGLREKTMAAYRGGVKTVLIPRENLKDLDELDKEAREHLQIIPCDTIEDVLSVALLPTEAKTIVKTSFCPNLSAKLDEVVRPGL